MNCKQRGDPLRFDKARLYSIKFSEISKGGTLYYVLNKARIKFGEINKGGTLYGFEQSQIKFSEMQRGDPLRFELNPLKIIEMQRGDPLCFE